MYKNCLACGNQKLEKSNFLVGREFPLWHCTGCGFGFVEFTPEYNNENAFDEYWDDVNQKIYTQKSVVNELEDKYLVYFKKLKNVKNKRLLDVGSGAGICVNTANQSGFDAMGVEPSENGVQLSQKTYGINVANDLLRADDNLPRDFGVLTLWDVIEHVMDPEELINTCAAHIEEHGYLVLETPNEGALVRKLVRALSRIIPQMDLRRSMYYRAHRFYFTNKAMHELLTRCGFDEISFYKERSMHEKAKMKLDLYFLSIPPAVRAMRKIVFWLMKRLPFTKNKMVVIARKSAA
ncbi:hypothetical protein MNBD_GAMMA15-623 [hydrothermal vent metagenome]|uniref:Uncharacterized protein n=1 Tax=hydrothermal vent metagenome TaxID=652676 RepID=A0A3B0YW84_9ZZZZ